MISRGLPGSNDMQGLRPSCLVLSLADTGLPGISTLKRVVGARAIVSRLVSGK